MSSRKPSAKAKRVEEFKTHLEIAYSTDDPFVYESARLNEAEKNKEAVKRKKACESKNRYSSRSEAERAIASCAEYGTTGLHCYQCPYCNGWHLTSKPQIREDS